MGGNYVGLLVGVQVTQALEEALRGDDRLVEAWRDHVRPRIEATITDPAGGWDAPQRKMESRLVPKTGYEAKPDYMGFLVAIDTGYLAEDYGVPCLEYLSMPLTPEGLAEKYGAEVASAQERWAAFAEFAQARQVNLPKEGKLLLIADFD